MKTILTPFLLALILLVSGCKKETLKDIDDTLPPAKSGWELLPDEDAEQYLVVVLHRYNDTILIQDSENFTFNLEKEQWPGLFGYAGVGVNYSSVQHPGYNFNLRFVEVKSSNTNVYRPVDCALIDTLMSQETFSLGWIQYGFDLTCNMFNYEYSTYRYHPDNYGAAKPVFEVKSRELISTAGGCNTYRFRGGINCVVETNYTTCTRPYNTEPVSIFCSFLVKVPQ